MKCFILLLFFVPGMISSSFAQLAKGDRTLAWQVDVAEDGNYDLAFSNATDACMEAAHLFATWNTVEPNQGNYDQGFIANFFDVINVYYPANGTSVELQLAPVNTNVLEMPSDLAGLGLDDPLVINQFKLLLDTIFAHIPDVDLAALNIGNESDIYFGTNATLYNQYKTFLDSVSPYAKQLYLNLHGTELLVGTTLTFDGLIDPLKGPLCAGLNSGRDIIATTYYPLNPDFTMESPTVVSSDFGNLVATYPSALTPIYFVECGYSSSPTCNSSEALQAQFYQEVFSAWDTYYDNIKYLTIFKTNDWSPADVDEFTLYYGISTIEFKEYLRTLGVRNWDGIGTKKLAFDQILCEVADRNWCTVSCPNVGLIEPKETDSFSLFPNPATNSLTVSITDPEMGTLRVLDLLGRAQKVNFQSENLSLLIIDISTLPSGTYLLEINSISRRFQRL